MEYVCTLYVCMLYVCMLYVCMLYVCLYVCMIRSILDPLCLACIRTTLGREGGLDPFCIEKGAGRRLGGSSGVVPIISEVDGHFACVGKGRVRGRVLCLRMCMFLWT